MNDAPETHAASLAPREFEGNSPKLPPVPLPRLAYSLREAAEVLGLSYSSCFRLVQRGLLRSSNALRHKLIPAIEIERFLKDTLR